MRGEGSKVPEDSAALKVEENFVRTEIRKRLECLERCADTRPTEICRLVLFVLNLVLSTFFHPPRK